MRKCSSAPLWSADQTFFTKARNENDYRNYCDLIREVTRLAGNLGLGAADTCEQKNLWTPQTRQRRETVRAPLPLLRASDSLAHDPDCRVLRVAEIVTRERCRPPSLRWSND